MFYPDLVIAQKSHSNLVFATAATTVIYKTEYIKSGGYKSFDISKWLNIKVFPGIMSTVHVSKHVFVFVFRAIAR